MALVVQKFGGSSISDADRVKSVAQVIERTVRAGHQAVVTVSAMGKETDELLRLAPMVSRVHPGREIDMLITSGERKAAALISLALQDLGIPAESLSGSQAGITTDASHTEATILDIQPDRIRLALEAGRVPVVGGAQGGTETGDVTFLGRGGTDTTAVALASALHADVCELYTDVRGVFTADPRVVSDAELLPRLTFEEMVEMCAAGCPKPATRAVELARKLGVPLHVRSASDPAPGTLVSDDAENRHGPTLAVVADRAQAVLTLAGLADRHAACRRLADAFAGPDMHCELIVRDADTAPGGVSCVVATPCLAAVERELGALRDELGGCDCDVDENVARVSVVGTGVSGESDLARRLGETLAHDGIDADPLLCADMRISWLVRRDAVEQAMLSLHGACHPHPRALEHAARHHRHQGQHYGAGAPRYAGGC